jgi:hypothetical protein
MTERIPQSTSKLVVFKAYLASDHTSEATGKTIAITISKNGGAFGNPNAGATNATEISSGWYKVTLDTTDTGTLGPLAVRGAVATVDDVGILLEVVSATSGGYTNLDAAVTSRMATYTQPTGFLSATFPAGTVANTTNITAGTVTTATNVTTVNGLAANVITATSIAADAITDAKVAADVTIASVTGSVGSVTGAVGSVTGAVGSVTGNVGGNVTGSVGSVVGLTASNLDAAVSSRLATAGYTAPDNASVTAIKAKTDSLTFTVAGQVDSNIQYVNDTLVTGNGSAGTPWGP